MHLQQPSYLQIVIMHAKDEVHAVFEVIESMPFDHYQLIQLLMIPMIPERLFKMSHIVGKKDDLVPKEIGLPVTEDRRFNSTPYTQLDSSIIKAKKTRRSNTLHINITQVRNSRFFVSE